MQLISRRTSVVSWNLWRSELRLRVAIISAIFKSPRSGKTVRLPRITPRKRIGKGQAMRRPAIEKPKLLKAQAGSA